MNKEKQEKNFDTRYNQNNEIVKYKFFEELENSVDGKDPKTVDQYIKAIHEFEIANNFKDFRHYNKDWAIVFKDHLNDKRNKQTKQHISKSYYFHYLSHVRTFFEWLLKNEKEYSKLKEREINFLGTTGKEKNQARVTGIPESHEIKDILSTIRNIPNETKEQRRNKAMLSLFLLTSPRISSLQEARIKSIRYFKEYDSWAFLQDPRLQNTKYSKKIIAFFVGNVEDIKQNVLNWRNELIEEGWNDKDYLFPKITPSFTKDSKSIMVLQKDYIRSDGQIRDIVKKAFVDNGIKYLKPHTFRHSIAREVKKKPNATELGIALAENYGQKTGMAVLFSSYAGDYLQKQAELVKGIELE